MCEVFVEVQNRGGKSAQGSIAICAGEKSLESVPFAVEADGRWPHIFNFNLPETAHFDGQDHAA